MNGLIFLVSLVLVGIVAWILVEKFAPGKLAGFKTKILNILGAIPVLGPQVADLLTGYNFGQFISADKLPWYIGALVVLNLFAYSRTAKSRDEGDYDTVPR